MSRKNRSKKRIINHDPIHNSTLVTLLINCVMKDGKKELAQHIVYGSLKAIEKNLSVEKVLPILEKAIENIKPLVELKSRRIGGSNYQVPVEVDEVRQTVLAIRWLVSYARLRNGKSMIEKLAYEINDAYNNTGACVKKRDEMHKTAEANKAFAQYRWS